MIESININYSKTSITIELFSFLSACCLKLSTVVKEKEIFFFHISNNKLFNILIWQMIENAKNGLG